MTAPPPQLRWGGRMVIPARQFLRSMVRKNS
jgi:hypothetical protein